MDQKRRWFINHSKKEKVNRKWDLTNWNQPFAHPKESLIFVMTNLIYHISEGLHA